MIEPVVILKEASVRYRSPEYPYLSFKEFAIRMVARKIKMKDFWALHDITFSVREGETFGIVGRNGAGKSTLLKLVSRVLAPTTGRIITRGHVAPLLELGAGFHFELTGRENVFLNGALLGHQQKEIRSHLDEIMDFAQLDGYIDAPLRTYSSGMVARLGFAVATSWVPDILILDEILAVGDEEFKKKCYARLNRFQTKGTTTFLVTHDLKTVFDRCDRALWLDQGRMMEIGKVERVVEAYSNNIKESEGNGSER